MKNYGIHALAAGHGDGDPGAVWGTETEAGDVIPIVDHAVHRLVTNYNRSVAVVNHSLNLRAQVNWVNDHYRSWQRPALAIEVHKNSAGNAQNMQADRVEIYYRQGNRDTAEYSTLLAAAISKYSGLPNGRARNDISPRFPRGLYWFKHVRIDAILIEMGFIQHNHNEARLGEALGTAIADVEGALTAPKEAVEVDPQRTVIGVFNKAGSLTDSRSHADFPLIRTKIESSGRIAFQHSDGLHFFKINDKGKIVAAKEEVIKEGVLTEGAPLGLAATTADGFKVYCYA